MREITTIGLAMLRHGLEPAHDEAFFNLLYQATPADFATLLGLDPDRVCAIAKRIEEQSAFPPPTMERAQDAPELERLILLDALLHLPPEQALHLLEQDNLPDLFRRWAFVPYLLHDATLLTLNELAAVLEECANHLEANRSPLIRMGVPLTTLGASWPGMMLQCIYPTVLIVREDLPILSGNKALVSPRDSALKHLPATARATRIHTYYWQRRETEHVVAFPDNTPSALTGRPWEWRPSEEASLILGLDEETAARLEASRDVFLELEIAVLGSLSRALRARDARGIWAEALRLLTDSLLADDVAFYLQMDQHFHGYDIAAGAVGGWGHPRFCPGGLSSLLEIIGHCEQELTVGSRDQTKRLMPRTILADDWFHSYFQAVGQTWQPELDRALDGYVDLMTQEASFWADYRVRVNQALQHKFNKKCVWEATLNARLAEGTRFEPLIQSEIDLQREHLHATGMLAALSSSIVGPPEPLAPARMIQTDGRVRTFTFEGRGIPPLRESKGLRFLSHLLLHPRQDIHVLALTSAVDHPGTRSSEIAASVHQEHDDFSDEVDDGSFFHTDRGEGTGAVLDPQAKREYRQEARRLESELAEAREVGDEYEIERIRGVLEQIEDERKRATGLRGRDRPMNSNADRARSRLSKQIHPAIREITARDPDLGHHLKLVKYSNMHWRYDLPPDQPRWERHEAAARTSP